MTLAFRRFPGSKLGRFEPSALTPLSEVCTPATLGFPSGPSSHNTWVAENPGRSMTSTPGISRCSIWAAIHLTILDSETIWFPWFRK